MSSNFEGFRELALEADHAAEFYTQAQLNAIQVATEHRYSKEHVLKRVRKDLLSSEAIAERMEMAWTILQEFQAFEGHDAHKSWRLSLVTQGLLNRIICDLLVACTVTIEVKTFAQMAGVAAESLPHDDYRDRVQTAAEMIWLVSNTQLVDIHPAATSPVSVSVTLEDGTVKKQRVMGVSTRVALSDEVRILCNQTMHIPPMLVKPLPLRTNKDCGYLTLKKGAILKSHLNYHNGDVCLDTLNLFNSNEYSLDVEFLVTVDDVMKLGKKNKTGMITKEQERDYAKFVEQSHHVYLEILKHGNKFYLTHHVDARGRTYSRGYHVNSQGRSFKKAMINWRVSLPIDIDEGTEDIFDLNF